MKIYCEVEQTLLLNDNNYEVDGVVATCSKCGQKTESFGTSEQSVKRCLVMLSEECLNEERNFYVESD